jgi:hypothetical protein
LCFFNFIVHAALKRRGESKANEKKKKNTPSKTH